MRSSAPTRRERWPLTKLIPYARNARTHSDEQVAQIAASIREFGFTVPVLVDEKGTLIAGHGRVLAAHQLGVTDVPTMVARGWTQAQIQAYRIADNQLALNAGWDRELLGIELGELKLGGFDLSLTGFGELELKDLLTERTAGLTDPDDTPAVPEHPVSQTGDLWLLGAKVTCPNCRKATPIERAIKPGSPTAPTRAGCWRFVGRPRSLISGLDSRAGARAPRTHSDAQVAAIAASIKEWGWTTPALVARTAD
jgi:ParB-like chromosome segregation protein Spo0J